MTVERIFADRPALPIELENCPGITIFDLDRTLTRRGTYSPFLLHVARRSLPWRLLFAPCVLACMIAYRFGIIQRSRLKCLMQALMIGKRIPRSRIERLTASFASYLIKNGLRPGARALIARECSAGRLVVLATAAHRFYAEPIARQLGITHLVATESEWDGDMLTARLDGSNCYGAYKLTAILKYLADLGWTDKIPHLRFYSDDASDLPTFDRSDEQIAVNPSRRLARIARRRGWPILWL